jgi:DNA-binding CsgD family transcriptional regulator
MRRSAALDRLLDLTYASGSQGRLIAVQGDPGAGKTHLVAALVQERQWTARPATFHQCLPTAHGQSVIDAVRTLLRRTRRPPGEVAVLSRQRRSPDRDLVVLEDVHLADEQTLRELIAFAEGTPDPLVDLVVTLRPRQTPPELTDTLMLTSAFGRTRIVEPVPLTDREMIEISGGSASHDLRRRSGGNPFALRALLALEQDQRAGVDALVAPFEIAVRREVRDLSLNERPVLHAAAILRTRFDVELLADVAGVDLDVASAAVRSLLRRDLVRPVGGDSLYSMRDEIFATLLRRSIDPCWAASAHQRAISRLSARGQGAKVGFHLASALSQVRDGELTRIIAAALDVMETDVSEAIYLLTPVLAETPAEGEPGLRARLALCMAFARVGRLEESRSLLFAVHEAEPPALDRETLAEAVAFVSGVEAVLSQDVQLVDLLSAHYTALRGTPAEPRLAFARGFRATMLGHSANRDEVAAALDGCADAVSRAGLLALLALAETADGDNTTGEAAAQRAGDLVNRSPEHRLAPALDVVCAVALAHIYLGRYIDARRHLQRGAALARLRQQTFLLPTLLVMLSESERQLGLLEKAGASADAAMIESSAGSSLRLSQAVALKSAAEVWTQPPGSGRARSLAQRALAQQAPSRIHVNGSAAIASLTLAQCSWLDGDPHHCVTLLLNEGRGDALPEVPSAHRSVVWELLCAAGMDAGLGLEPWARLCREHAERHPTAPNRAYAALGQGHLSRTGGALANAARHYREAAEIFASSGMVVAQACALAHTARTLAELGRAGQSAAPAELATELARRTAAPTLSAWIERLMGEVSAPLAGITELDVFNELTAREREVALLLCAGRKRSEIAAQLTISARTVDVHITRIYRKTGVASHVELALAVGRTAL